MRALVAIMLRELREGWTEFWSHTWLWATVFQFTVILAAWYGSFQVLGPAVAKAHLGGAQAWGLISASEAIGLIAGGIVALKRLLQTLPSDLNASILSSCTAH